MVGGSDLVSRGVKGTLLLFMLPLVTKDLVRRLCAAISTIVIKRFAKGIKLTTVSSMRALFGFPVGFVGNLTANTAVVVSECFKTGSGRKLRYTIQATLLLTNVLKVVYTTTNTIFSP